MMNIRLPNITAPTEREQLMQVKSYLHQLAQELNWALSTIEASNIAEAKQTELSGAATKYEGNYGIYFAGGGMRDVVVEEGTSGIWSYRKWSSGVAECWGVHTSNSLNCGTTTSGGFYCSDTVSVALPLNLFITDPVVVFEGGSFNYLNFVRSYGTSKTEAKYIVAGLINTTADVYVRILAKGRWK